MRYQKTLFIACALLLPASGHAEVNVGGWAGTTFDGGTSVGGLDVRTNTLVSYDQPNFSFGIGFNNIWFYDGATNSFIDGSGGYYALARIQNATLSFGEMYGAGNLFPEDYFGLEDTTSISDEIIRFDFQAGGHRFAVSNDLNGSGPSELELGYSGTIAGHDVAVGFEADSDEVGFLVGRDVGAWGFQIAAIQDIYNLPGSWNHAGLTVFRDLTPDLTVAGNITYGTDSTTDLHSFGILATYKIGGATIKVELLQDVVNSRTDTEIGVVIPFGKLQPSGRARFEPKEYRPRYVR